MKQDIFDNPYEEYKHYGFETEWTMRDHTIIKIKNMQDSHVCNCIRMLRNNINKNLSGFDFKTNSHYWLEVFEDVILKRRIEKIKRLKQPIGGCD